MSRFDNYHSKYTWILLACTAAVIAILILRATTGTGQRIARGKSAALPLQDGLSPEQQRAQNLALSDPRVQQHTAGHRAEVFGVRRLLANQATEQSQSCADADCRQVEIYVFDEDISVVAIVNLATGEVLDVLVQAGVHPGISRQQADRALAIAMEAPEVINALGFRPLQANTAPVPGNMPDTACEGGHYCVAPNFEVDGRRLWAVVDLTSGELVGVRWSEVDTEPPGRSIPSIPQGCPPPGSVSRDGWELSYATTGTDGLRVYDVSYEGMPVLSSVKHLEWHVDYDFFGYLDETGCSGGGGGFPIYPFGPTQVLTMTDQSGAAIGFEVVQDFRMSNWGATCNYRYEPRLQFYEDGRFRIASGIYGKGCQASSVYRPIVRIDIAVAGDEGDTFNYLAQNGWTPAITETYRTPYQQEGHGPHFYDASGAAWSVFDESGRGFLIVADRGQYPQSRGAAPFLYVTQHRDAEGEIDMGIIGQCCNDDYRQGPEAFVNGEGVAGTNIVLWYVPQMTTEVDATTGEYYCWTVNGEPDPETYPCIVGPLFVPFTPSHRYHLPLVSSE